MTHCPTCTCGAPTATTVPATCKTCGNWLPARGVREFCPGMPGTEVKCGEATGVEPAAVTEPGVMWRHRDIASDSTRYNDGGEPAAPVTPPPLVEAAKERWRERAPREAAAMAATGFDAGAAPVTPEAPHAPVVPAVPAEPFDMMAALKKAMGKRAAVPVCATWCGTDPEPGDRWDPAVFMGTRSSGTILGTPTRFCTQACADAGRPLNPGPGR